MKQVLRKGFTKVVVEDIPAPRPTSGKVIIQTAFSLISPGTEMADLHPDGVIKEAAANPSHFSKIFEVAKKTGPVAAFRELRAKFSDYSVIGYSGSGTIIDVGPGISDLKIGQRVAYGGEGTGHGEFVSVGRNLVARIPDSVSLEQATFSTLGSIALNAIRLGKVGIGDHVAVIGLGLVGQLIAQLATASGAVCTVIDILSDRIDLAKRLGAAFAILPSSDLNASVDSITSGRGFDRVFIAAATESPLPLRQAISISRERGSLILVGDCPIDVSRDEMYAKELRLIVSRAYGPGSYDKHYENDGIDYPFSLVRWTENRNMEEVLRLIGAGRLRVDDLITHRFKVDDAESAYRAIIDKSIKSLAIILEYSPRGSDTIVSRKVNTTYCDEQNLPGNQSETGLGVAVFGAGNLAKWAHLPAIIKTKKTNLIAIGSNNGARAMSYAKRFRALYATTDEDTILNDPSVNSVIISTRNSDHARLALKSLDAGKHVLVEKPMAIKIEDCRLIEDAVNRNGKKLCVGFNRRFAPSYRKMKETMRRFRGPFLITATIASPGIDKTWAVEESEGGVFLSEACHFIDLFYWLIGSEPTKVYATSSDNKNIIGVLEFEDGSRASLLYTTFGSSKSVGEQLEVFSADARLYARNFKEFSVVGAGAGKYSTWFPQKGYNKQFEAFIDYTKGLRSECATAKDGTRATLGCLLMLRSAQLAKELPFDEGQL